MRSLKVAKEIQKKSVPDDVWVYKKNDSKVMEDDVFKPSHVVFLLINYNFSAHACLRIMNIS